MSKSPLLLFLANGVFLFVAAIAGRYFLHDAPFWVIPLIILGLGAYITLVAHTFLGLIPRWRQYYVSVDVFCIVTIILIGAYLAISVHFWVCDKQMAHDYVTTIQPRLEDFRHTHHQYPDSLSQVGDLSSIPIGLIYSHEHDAFQDTYRFDYKNTCQYWSGTGQWFDDD